MVIFSLFLKKQLSTKRIMGEKFFIEGGVPLSGTVEISGSKNAALPILAASLLCNGTSKISHVPQIDDVQSFLEIITSLNCGVEVDGENISISAENITLQNETVNDKHIKKMRASILLLAPLLVRFGEVKIPFPGGCVLGKRSAESHLVALRALGAEVKEVNDIIHIVARKGLRAGKIVLPECSVTATENAIMAASAIEGESEIRMAAAEPHVQNLCHFLVSAGAKIEGIGSHTLRITGNANLQNGEIAITPDYLEAGTFILAAAATNSQVTIQNVEEHHLDSFFQKLGETGVSFEILPDEKTVRVLPKTQELQPTQIKTGIFPGFATDLHPQFAVLLTQCQGTSKIFERLFERKFAYLLELEKMGADVEIMNPHQFLIHGGKKLQGTAVASQDIRAGAAMLIAALAAEGETEISNIHYIHRGYQNIEEKFQKLGAKIKKVME